MIKYIGRAIREEKGYTVRKLSVLSTIAISTISKWENGKAMPDLNLLDVMACALDCNPWDLIEFKKGESNE